jgi:hypothetical protein
VLLYELALELGVRSTALLDRAQALGMDVTATAPLTAEQVAELRAAYGKQRPTPAVAETVAPVVDPAARSFSTGSVLALVGAGLVVVLLIAYMVTNSGDDGGSTVAANEIAAEDSTTTTTEPCDANSGIGAGAIGQSSTSAATDGGAGGSALPPCSVAGGLSDDALETTTTADVDPIDLPRDKREFCRGALAAMEFDTKLMEAAQAETIGPLRDVIIQGRDKWKADATIMTINAPPRLDMAMDRYTRVYINLVDSVTPEIDDLALAEHIINTFRTDLNYYAAQINESINTHCDKR